MCFLGEEGGRGVFFGEEEGGVFFLWEVGEGEEVFCVCVFCVCVWVGEEEGRGGSGFCVCGCLGCFLKGLGLVFWVQGFRILGWGFRVWLYCLILGLAGQKRPEM